jgi:hypothetical protein
MESAPAHAPADDVRVQRHLLALATPPDPLTPAERQAVRDTAESLLAQDPQHVGLSLRDSSGYPGYSGGANHISYLLAAGTRNTGDILDEPGVHEWLHSVRVAATDERVRIGYTSDPWWAPEQALERLVAAGYLVERHDRSVVCRHPDHTLPPRVR